MYRTAWTGLITLSAIACSPAQHEVAPSAVGEDGGAQKWDVADLGGSDSGLAPKLDGASAEGVLDAAVHDVRVDAGQDAPVPGARVNAALFPPLREGPVQLASLCARGYADAVTDAFCARPTPQVASLAELFRSLGVEPRRQDGAAGFALTGHSTALSSRSVSAINPRVVFVHLPNAGQELLSVAFTRGEPIVEAVARDRVTAELRFYLFRFTLACEYQAGCLPGDLLTPAIERDWVTLDLYSDADLADTVIDCLHCHQPDGPGSPKLLRMQELDGPWTHWFSATTFGGRALVADYVRAKGDEAFAGLTREDIETTEPTILELLVQRTNGESQPNQFDSGKIEAEVKASAAALGGNQPEDNSVPGESPTWRTIYGVARRGDAIPVPYHDVKITDAGKLDAMTRAYADYRAGRLASPELPDIRQVLPDDPLQLSHMGFSTEPGLDAEAALVQACAQCHNRRLDQTLKRAHFDVVWTELSADERREAVRRLELPAEHVEAMPPRRIRSLRDDVRMALIDLLRP